MIEKQNEEPGVTTIKNPDGTTTHTLLACIEKTSAYRPGDILYVQETFRIDYLSNVLGTGRVHYKADDTYADFIFSPERYEMLRRAQRKPGWRPNKNMPREAARIFLRVTNVYPQRLKDVTETDARAEGFHSRAEFMSAILKMYPECMEDSWFWANDFERISREEVGRWRDEQWM